MSNSDYNYYNSNSYPYNSYYPAVKSSSPVSDRRIFTGMAARSKSGSNSHGSYSGYGSSSHESCCPLVVDPLTLLSLGAFLAAAVYLLNELIAMSMLMRRRKRSLIKSKNWPILMLEGRSRFFSKRGQKVNIDL